MWRVNDMTDSVQRWDITQFGGPFYNTFADIVAFFAAFPNHKVVSGSLVQDAFTSVMQGLAYYDDIQIGRRTLG